MLASLIASSTKSLPNPFFSSFFYFLSEIEKQIGRFNAFQNLESSGSKIIANGPDVCKLCQARKVDRNWRRDKILEIRISHSFILQRLHIDYCRKGFKACSSIFGVKIGLNYRKKLQNWVIAEIWRVWVLCCHFGTRIKWLTISSAYPTLYIL